MAAQWTTTILSPGLFLIGVLTIIYWMMRNLRQTGSGRLAYLRSLRIKSKWQQFRDTLIERLESSGSNVKLRNKLKLAGNPMGATVWVFQMTKLGLLALISGIYGMRFVLSMSAHLNMLKANLLQFMFAVLCVWFVPDGLLILLAKRRKTRLMFEISKLSHRLTLCIAEKSELREVIMRAGRTLTLLKPYLNELSVRWNKNQSEAIAHFGKEVGITEIFPLVNTLVAVSNVDHAEVSKMLDQQVDNIDKTLEHEIQRKTENAPLLIIFLIMIPFMVVFVLLIYPWIAYLSDQLATSFGGGGLS